MVSGKNDDLLVEDYQDLFDTSIGYDDESAIVTAPDLSQDELLQARRLYFMFNELMGVIAVKGDPGSGKDVFGNYLQYKLKKFFPSNRYLRDERPRPLFGKYDGIFNDKVIQSDLQNMKDISKGVGSIRERQDVMAKAADDWVKGAGEVLLKNSVLYLTEYGTKWCYYRSPFNPMNITMGSIQKLKRHLHTLIIATTQLFKELDKTTSKPWIDWRVTCTRSKVNPTGHTYYIEKVSYDIRRDLFHTTPGARPYSISFDAGKPRSEMGNGLILVKKPKYKPENENERIVLDALKSGISNYETLVDVLEDHDMPEYETLQTVKELGLKLPNRRPKFIIEYPCYYKLYNSKSAVELKSNLKVVD